MADHMYGRTIWPYIWFGMVWLHFSLYGILPYIWLSTKYMAPNHIIWFKTIYMVVYSVWESTQNSKSASEYAHRRAIFSSSGEKALCSSQKRSFLPETTRSTDEQNFQQNLAPQGMVRNPYIWYATKYLVYGRIYGIWLYIW